ncbi:MAG: hypothetical protein WC703_04930 [Candidatus Neomarinimicrobiota bacterium]
MKSDNPKQTIPFLQSIGIILCMLFTAGSVLPGSPVSKNKNIDSAPIWLIAGPFEQQIVGFGDFSDMDIIGEQTLEPFYGKEETSALTANQRATWRLAAPDPDGYIDFNQAIGWELPGKSPEKILYAKEGFAATYITSPVDQNVYILTGSNSRLKVWLNHQVIYSKASERGAVADDDTISAQFKKGTNILLVRVTNSHRNLQGDWFFGTPLGWGFYARITDRIFRPLTNIEFRIPKIKTISDFDIESTFFFKKIDGVLNQRFDLVVNTTKIDPNPAEFSLTVNKKTYRFPLTQISVGISRHELYVPEIGKDENSVGTLKWVGTKTDKAITLKHRKHYQLYLNMVSHMDIGYTNIQPVVIERHIQTLDEVLDYCKMDPEFKWNIETTWCLEKFRESRSEERFRELINLVKEKRIDISPLYSNPFTGWVSYEEMLRSFDLSRELSKDYGLTYHGALVNDLPGLAWVVPQLLKQAGVSFLACGINEIYGGYVLQQNLPKVFYWEGSDGSKVLTYLTEAYTEGRSYGLEKGLYGIQMRLWHHLNKLEARDYPYDLIYLNAAMCDNCGIPEKQYEAAKEWNRRYEFPKFIISTISQFADDFTEEYADRIPTIRGDWTSDWDILTQSEPELFIKHRDIQSRLYSAEKLNSLNWLINSNNYPLEDEIRNVYRSILEFSGHGSGLELGYGSVEENALAVSYRQGNIQSADLKSEEILQRSLYVFCKPHFSFDANGFVVFNTLSWDRDAVVEVSLPIVDLARYKVINMVDGAEVPSYQKDHRIVFTARNLPSLGYRKYELVNQTGESSGGDELSMTGNTIENRYYCLTFDPVSGKITDILDKKTGRKVVESKDGTFAHLLRVSDSGKKNAILTAGKTKVQIKDERPVRLVLEIERPGYLLENETYALWSDLDQVDMDFTIDVSWLNPTDVLEEYSIAFPFCLDNPEFRIETIGGFLNPLRDGFPGKRKDSFSIRRSVFLEDSQSTVTWAALDSRVVSLKKFTDGQQTALYSNIINNFPEQWNRNQIDEGRLKTRFSFTAHAGKFDPAITSRFGWEAVTKPSVFRCAFNRDHPEGSYLTIDNPNIILLSMRTNVKNEEVVLDFLNIHPEKSQEAQVSSVIFDNSDMFSADLFQKSVRPLVIKDKTITIRLSANGMLPVVIKNKRR